MGDAPNPFRNQIGQALHAVVIRPRLGFEWFGRPITVLGPRLKGRISRSSERDLLVAALQSHLYQNFYCKGQATPHPWVPVRGGGVSSMLPFVERLSAANQGPGYWQDGWAVRSVTGDRAVVVQNRLAVNVPVEECCDPESVQVRAGSTARLRLPNERRSPATGAYLAMHGNLFGPQTQVIRTYWNVTPDGAVELVGRLTETLSHHELPFNLKVLTDTSSPRCDAAVLYTRLADHMRVVELINPIHAGLGSCMKGGVPALTKEIARGLAVAEEPSAHTSFGLQRCGILAEAVVAADQAGCRGATGREAFVRAQFAAHGIDPDQPYRQHAANDAFEFGWKAVTPSHTRRAPAPAGTTYAATLTEFSEGDPRLLRVAIGLGERICHEALWSGCRCTWFGPVQTSSRVVHLNLGPDFYGGTSGIALFLAYLNLVQPDPRFAETALAAIEQAVATFDRLPVAARLGLFTGGIGVALAGMHVAVVTGSSRALSGARSILAQCVTAAIEGSDNDLIGGLAGAVVGMLALARLLGDESLVGAAARYGDELLVRARKPPQGWSWRTHSQPGDQHLTGLSHGASGIAYSMLALYEATGEQRYAEAARQAFLYERAHFDPTAANWRDLRGISRARRAADVSPFAGSWCHGAPGIAVARIRAVEVDAGEEVREEALLALQTTALNVSKALDSPSHFSLCHGLAGNAEILRLGRHAVIATEADDLPSRVAAAGIERFFNTGTEWPCLLEAEPSLGLLTGLAGVGYFYLRMYDSRLPSVLTPSDLSATGAIP